jgi:hypothetical protein
MANGYQFPYGFQQGNLLTAQRPTASSFFQAAQQGKFGLPKPYEPQSSMLAPTMAAIQSRTTQPLATPTSVAMPTAPLARSRFLQEQQGAPLPRPRPEGMPPSGLDQLTAAQLRMPPKGSPEAAGLSAAGTQLLAAGGWQDRPVTLGQTLASGMQAYTTAKKEAEQLQYDKQRQALADQLALAGFQLDVQKAMQPQKPETTAAITNALAMGLKMGSPEFNEYIRMATGKKGQFTRMITNPDGSVEFITGTGEVPELASKTKGDLESKLLSSDATLNSLVSARDMYNETMSQFAPRFNMAMTNIKSGFGFKVSDEDRQDAIKFVETASRINEVFSDTLNELSGAAVSKQENTRIRTSYGYLGSIANPFSGDSPIEFQAKINGQINSLRSINIRAKLLLTGNQKITDDLARKYPLDYTVDGETIFFSDFIDDALASDLAKTEMEAANLWADEISELRAEEANQ